MHFSIVFLLIAPSRRITGGSHVTSIMVEPLAARSIAQINNGVDFIADLFGNFGSSRAFRANRID
jgi:hypothetical protein